MNESKEASRDASSYVSKGASASKPDVKAAIRDLDPGLFPNAFCKAVPDGLTGSAEHCLLAHSDGAGTKSALAYLHYKRHGRADVFRGIAQDSVVMNLDDLLCVGATSPFILSNTIGRNIKNVPGEVVKALIHGYEDFCDSMRDNGIEIASCGGETADLGDLVRTVVVDSCLTTRMRRDAFVDCSKVKAGQVIVGLASHGKASYESADNSGIGTNGFTALRHGLFSSVNRSRHPETFAPEIGDMAYTGAFDLDDPLPGTTMSLGEACLSPTRTYAPIVRQILAARREAISAMFHNTGGGQTKCLNFGRDVHYVKDALMPLPPLFEFIRTNALMPRREMMQVFNMGHRFEIVCEAAAAGEVIAIAESFAVAARVVGRVEAGHGRSLTIGSGDERLEYDAG